MSLGKNNIQSNQLGFSKHKPIVIDQEVENYFTYAYAQVAFVCDRTSQPWRIISYAERHTEKNEMIEVEFEIQNPKNGRPPVIQSMYFDITDCIANNSDGHDEGGDHGLWEGNGNDTPRGPFRPDSIWKKDGLNRGQGNSGYGFRSFR